MIRLLLLLSLSSTELLALPAFRLLDAYGQALRHLNFKMGSALAEDPSSQSLPIQVKVLGPQQFGSLYALVGSCSLGGHALPRDAVTLLFDGQAEMPLERASDFFSISLLLRNPEGWAGALFCDQISVRVASEKIADAVIEGEVQEAPVWQDASGRAISLLSFDFSGMVVSPDSVGALESRPVQARLLHASAYPAAVRLERPRNCRIGTLSISDDKIALISSGQRIQRDDFAMLASDRLQTFAIRIQGPLASASGSVFCARVGSLSYTY